MNDMTVTMVYQLHDNSRVTVLNECVCLIGDDTVISAGVAFAHVAGLEVWVGTNGGPLVHYPNIDALADLDAIAKRLKK